MVGGRELYGKFCVQLSGWSDVNKPGIYEVVGYAATFTKRVGVWLVMILMRVPYDRGLKTQVDRSEFVAPSLKDMGIRRRLVGDQWGLLNWNWHCRARFENAVQCHGWSETVSPRRLCKFTRQQVQWPSTVNVLYEDS